MDDNKTRIATSAAFAVLYDLLSTAYSYPDRDVLEVLADSKLQQHIEQIGCESLTQAAEMFGIAQKDFAQPVEQAQLESDYISLFELNAQQQPLHLNGCLYTDGKSEPVPVYQRLITIYREFGIELRDGEGVERPDHLTVQLEFMGYLYQLLGRALRGESNQTVESIEAGINAFHSELSWVPRWLALFNQRGVHALYTPLGRMLEALLQCSATAL